MALTKNTQNVLTSQTITASGSAVTSSSFVIGYGVSGVVTVTNGGSAPTTAGDVIEQLSFDGGTTWVEWQRRTPGLTASAVYNFPFSYGICGLGGDMTHYRIVVNAPTGQNVTVIANASEISAL